jgi:TonB-linked SusC/RagA family outer membrane protein
MKKHRPFQDVFFLLMRISLAQFVIAVAFGTLVSATDLKGQAILNKKVSLDVKNKKIQFVLASIEKQTAAVFTYGSNLKQAENKVSISVDSTTLESVLRVLFASGVSWEVVNNEVILRPVEIESASIENNVVAIQISGQVKDESGSPLPGVNVLVKGTTNGTSTDVNGKYTLSVADESAVLIFSFIGYLSQERTVGNQLVIDVVMTPDISTLSEIIVVGYGEAKKENYSGSVASISTKQITQNPQADISNTLAGRLPGVIAVQPNGQPGADGSNIYIRGVSTTGNNNALVVIDGIPRDDYGFSQVDPNEIETLTVLKDAAAAAVFGVRGANGVILITTKRGKSGKTVLSFTARTDIQQPTRLPQFLNSFDMATLYNEGLRNEGKPELYSAADLQKYKDGSSPDTHPNTDWLAIGLKSSAPTSQYNLNVSGGTDKARYFLSWGYLDQKGLYDNIGYKRYNFRANIDVEATSTTTIRFDAAGRFEDRQAPHTLASQLFYGAVRTKPTQVAYYANGLPGFVPDGNHPIEATRNSGYRNSRTYVLMNALTVTQRLPFVNGLSVKGVLAYDKSFNLNKEWQTPFKLYNYNVSTDEYIPAFPTVSQARLYQSNNDNYNATVEAHLNYDRVFGRHGVRALVLFSQNSFDYNMAWASRANYLSASVDELYAGPAATAQNDGSSQQRARRGVVGRFNYDLNNKYFLEANFRFDGSENFAPDKRWGFFPAVSAAWKISDEGFFKNAVPVFGYLKLRGSWGQLGNDKIERSAYLSAFGYSGNYAMNGQVVQTIAEARLGNPNITWEKATSTNIGIEGSVFDDRLTFEVDYFSKETSDILGQRNLSIPSTSGIPDDRRPFENVAIVQNRGFEINLGYNNSIGDNLRYFISANFTHAKNELLFADESPNVPAYQKRTGQPLNQFFGYKAIGFFQSSDDITNSPAQTGVMPGDIKYADINNDNRIDGADQTFIGNSPVPQNVFGLNMGLSFKGIDFNMLWQGASKVSAMPGFEAALAFFNGGKALTRHADSWRPDNRDASYPIMTSAPNANTSLTSSFFLMDASYVRLKNVYLGYTFPNKLLGKSGIKDVKIFVSGQNLVTISDIKDFDPEGISQGNSRGWFYPQQRVYSVGLNFNF